MRFLPIILFAFLALACAKTKPVADVDTVRPLTGIASAAARADVRADSIIELVESIKEIADKKFAELVTNLANGIKTDVKTVGKQLDAATDAAAQAQAKLQEANAVIVKAQSDLDAERNHWLGKKLRDTLAWIIGIAVSTWAILGLLSVVLGISSPLGVGMVWSKRIVRILPFANPFSWLRDRSVMGAAK